MTSLDRLKTFMEAHELDNMDRAAKLASSCALLAISDHVLEIQRTLDNIHASIERIEIVIGRM